MQNSNRPTKSVETSAKNDYNENVRHRLKPTCPKLTKAEWSLLNNRLEIELRNDDNYLDEYTKWLYASKNGVRVFSIYGIGDGTDATPLLAVGGNKADKLNAKMQKFLENGNDEFNGSREDFKSWLEAYTIKKGKSGDNISKDGNRGATIGDGSVHNGKRESNRAADNGRSTENIGEVKHSLKDSEGNGTNPMVYELYAKDI